MMEAPGAIVQFLLGVLDLGPAGLHLLPEPGNPHLVDNVLHPGPVPVLPVAPFLVRSDDSVKGLHRSLLPARYPQRLAHRREGREAGLLPLAPPDVYLEPLDLVSPVQEG